MPCQQEALILSTFISCMLTKEILWIFEDNWTPGQLKSTLLDCTGGPWDKINAVTGKQWESTPCTKKGALRIQNVSDFSGNWWQMLDGFSYMAVGGSSRLLAPPRCWSWSSSSGSSRLSAGLFGGVRKEVGLIMNMTTARRTQAIAIMAKELSGPPPLGPGNCPSWLHSLSVQYDWDWRRRLSSLLIAISWLKMHSQGSKSLPSAILARSFVCLSSNLMQVPATDPNAICKSTKGLPAVCKGL